MKYVMSILLLLSLAGATAISDIVVSTEGVNTKLAVNADAPFVANAFTLSDPARIVIDCSGVTSDLVGKTFTVNRGGIKEIAVTGFTAQPDLIRIVGKLNQDYSYLTLTENNNFVVTLLTTLVAPFPT
jgi:hypothetical protein